ncbi:hypothetical protein LCGC14_2555820, partial [marine sediment metagenome]
MAFQFAYRTADAEVYSDPKRPRTQRTTIYPGRRWVKDAADGIHKPYVERLDVLAIHSA